MSGCEEDRILSGAQAVDHEGLEVMHRIQSVIRTYGSYNRLITGIFPFSFIRPPSTQTLVNRETFYALPLCTQQMLAKLLPWFDWQKDALKAHHHDKRQTTNDTIHSSGGCPVVTVDETVTALMDANDDALLGMEDKEVVEEEEPLWLHQSALNNEFFNKALVDYASRQAQGDFLPRVRNRAGLRASVGNRPRYNLQAVSSGVFQDKRNSSDPVSFFAVLFFLFWRVGHIPCDIFCLLHLILDLVELELLLSI